MASLGGKPCLFWDKCPVLWMKRGRYLQCCCGDLTISGVCVCVSSLCAWLMWSWPHINTCQLVWVKWTMKMDLLVQTDGLTPQAWNVSQVSVSTFKIHWWLWERYLRIIFWEHRIFTNDPLTLHQISLYALHEYYWFWGTIMKKNIVNIHKRAARQDWDCTPATSQWWLDLNIWKVKNLVT